MLNASASETHSEIKLLSKTDSFYDIEIGLSEVKKGYLQQFGADQLFYEKLGLYILDHQIPHDRIIFRYPFASTGLKRFTERFYKKIVFEHNTKETEELQLSIRSKNYAPFSLRPSQFFFWFREKFYPLYCERRVAKKVFGNAHSGACVTSEIAVYETKRSPSYRTFVSSNFYDVSEAALSGSKYETGEMLVMGMIVTTAAPWYGLDRLFRSFAPVQDRFKIIIAGIGKDHVQVKKLLSESGVSKNIEFLGRIGKAELASFYHSVHVCFGSLGLYHINLDYASTLKVKESVSFGVPVVIGYQEEDFVQHMEFAPYYMQLKNDGSAIDFNAIKAFAAGFYAQPGNKAALRDLASRYLDVHVKMKFLLDQIN